MPLRPISSPFPGFALFVPLVCAAMLAGCHGNNDSGSHVKSNASRIDHVFIIVLENKSFRNTFGPDSPAPYLARTLTSRGVLLTRYYATSHPSNGNYIAMISGQAPNIANQKDCTTFSEFRVGSPEWADYGQIRGRGCVYPAAVKTIANQLTAAGLTWKGYMEDMGNNPERDDGTTCAHPEPGARDKTFSTTGRDMYVTRHNPFVYFHSIIDSPDCGKHVVPLRELGRDLHRSRVPNYVFITPNLCHDGDDDPCANGKTGGLPAADAFLKVWVPRIMASPAYREGGLLIVTFDEAARGSSDEDFAACCHELPGPNKQLGGQPGIKGPGGGRIGTLLLSPFITPGATNDTPFNHYSMLRSVEDLFGLKHLGFARRNNLHTFAGAGLFDTEPK